MATYVAEFVGTTAGAQSRPRRRPASPAPAVLLGPDTAVSSFRTAYSRSVSCSALRPGDYAIPADSIAPATPAAVSPSGHDSLLQTATGSAWEYLESVRSIQLARGRPRGSCTTGLFCPQNSQASHSTRGTNCLCTAHAILQCRHRYIVHSMFVTHSCSQT